MVVRNTPAARVALKEATRQAAAAAELDALPVRHPHAAGIKAYVKQTEEAYAKQVRQRLEKQLRRRAKELGFKLRKAEVEPAPQPA